MKRWGSIRRVRILAVPVAAALVGMAVVAPSALADASQCDAVAGNLVQNCGFEIGGTGWLAIGGGDAPVSDFAAHSGSYGDFVTVTDGSDGGAGGESLSQTISVVPGSSYALSYWLYPALPTSDSSYVLVVSGVVGGFLGFDSASNDNSQTWEQFTHTVTAAGSAITITFTIAQVSIGSDDVYLDDVSLVPLVVCDHSYTGTVTHSIVATSGVTCVNGATVNGAIIATGNATVNVTNSTVWGSVSASGGATLNVSTSTVHGSITFGAAAVKVCGTRTSALSVHSSTGPVTIGDPNNGCAANIINGSLTAISNTGGGTISGNTITGNWTITGNNPAFTVTGNHK